MDWIGMAVGNHAGVRSIYGVRRRPLLGGFKCISKMGQCPRYGGSANREFTVHILARIDPLSCRGLQYLLCVCVSC